MRATAVRIEISSAAIGPTACSACGLTVAADEAREVRELVLRPRIGRTGPPSHDERAATYCIECLAGRG